MKAISAEERGRVRMQLSRGRLPSPEGGYRTGSQDPPRSSPQGAWWGQNPLEDADLPGFVAAPVMPHPTFSNLPNVSS